MSVAVTTNGIPMRCLRDGNTWVYHGKNPYVAACTFCKSSLSIRKNRLDAQGIPAKSSPESLNLSPKEVLNSNG